MRKRYCKGRYYKAGSYHDFQIGQFHQWGNSYEEFESGPGNYTVAVVELPDGNVVMPMADDICFLEDEAINQLIDECACNERLVFTMAGARDILNRYRDHVCMTMLKVPGSEESKMMYSLFNALNMGGKCIGKFDKAKRRQQRGLTKSGFGEGEKQMNKKYSWTENQTDDIWYHGEFASVKACIKDAISCGKRPGEKIVIGLCEEYTPHLNADTLLDQVSEDAYEEVGEVAEGWPEFVDRKGYKDIDKLQEKIDKAFNEWLEETKQIPSFYQIRPFADFVTIPN